MNDADILLEASGLHRYYGRHHAVQDLSFALRKGQVLGFLGPNGAGKSTTMQMLAGVLAPSRGRIRIAGHDLLEDPASAKLNVGYLPEQPPLHPELTVDEYLAYCARLRRIPRAGVAAARDMAKQRCGLTEVGGRLIGNLSKGYQQRVGIAQAIIHSPAVVILDEPTVGLDPIQIREIRTLISELGREHAVILSTHILPEVQTVCSHVQMIHRGRLVFSESLAGLDARLAGSSLLVGLLRTPGAAALSALGATDVIELSTGRYRVSGITAEALAAAAVRGDWGLLELTPERKTLEQVFVELTTTDEAGAAPAGEAA
jgi:ABC-2 type transport system ATP-binding protein